MEEAGRAVAVVALAMLGGAGERRPGPVLVLAGPGNNGGDGHVAARHLAAAGIRSVVALASTDPRPGTRDAALNWDRLDGIGEVDRLHLASAHDARLLLNGIERAGLVIDALLGTGVRGALREPILSAVDVCLRARSVGVPVLAVDTPTAVDPTSGAPSDPAVRADVTITFHRPRTGLRTRTGSRLAGRVLVAPIGIPPLADRP
jgi:NAD(P)H-hydrate epimerase